MFETNPYLNIVRKTTTKLKWDAVAWFISMTKRMFIRGKAKLGFGRI